jgi:hypothetical protein
MKVQKNQQGGKEGLMILSVSNCSVYFCRE